MKRRKFSLSKPAALRPEAVGIAYPQITCAPQVVRGVCVLRIVGPLEHRASGWFESYEGLLHHIEGAMRDDEIGAVLLQIDSPGGEVSGLNETVARIRKLRAEFDKPVVAYADDEAYSAAYALCCAADEVYLPPTGGLGSIGVLAVLCDRTEQTAAEGLRVEVVRSGDKKADGHPDIPLDKGALERTQSRVDSLAESFFDLVSSSRGVSKAAVKALQGSVLYGQDAVRFGLADGISDFQSVLDGLASEVAEKSSSNYTNTPTKGKNMAFAALQRRVDTAKTALAKAKSKKEKAEAEEELISAISALTEAKVRKEFRKVTRTEESEVDDGEEEKAEDAEDAEEDDDEDDGEDSSAKMKVAKKAKKAEIEDEEKAEASSALLAFVKSLTGQSSPKAAKEVLAAAHELAIESKRLKEENAKLKASEASVKLQGLISSALAAGKLKPAQVDWAAKQSFDNLKEFIEAAPVAFQPSAVEPLEAKVESADADGLTPAELTILKTTGLSKEAFLKARGERSSATGKKVL